MQDSGGCSNEMHGTDADITTLRKMPIGVKGLKGQRKPRRKIDLRKEADELEEPIKFLFSNQDNTVKSIGKLYK